MASDSPVLEVRGLTVSIGVAEPITAAALGLHSRRFDTYVRMPSIGDRSRHAAER